MRRPVILSEKQHKLIDIPEQPVDTEQKLPTASKPVWTDNKAKFIMSYLRYFVLLTKHGTYIDGFAGPQEEADDADSWTAKLVLESQPSG